MISRHNTTAAYTGSVKSNGVQEEITDGARKNKKKILEGCRSGGGRRAGGGKRSKGIECHPQTPPSVLTTRRVENEFRLLARLLWRWRCLRLHR